MEAAEGLSRKMEVAPACRALWINKPEREAENEVVLH